LDRLRQSTTEAAKLREVGAGTDDAVDAAASAPSEDEGIEDEGIEDDRLRLIFTCCHPSLPLDARVALTLRTLSGMTTAELARAFLVPSDRTGPVLDDVAVEAIRLTRALVALLPATTEAEGLLALLLLQHSRRRARFDGGGDITTLEEQDRTLWDGAEIEEAGRLLSRPARPGPYRLQAAIAACHGDAAGPEDTDWPRIVALYDQLATMLPSPVVELNRAVAVAMAEGPQAGLRLLAGLETELAGYYLLPAVRADLLRRLGRRTEAAGAYRHALDLVPSESERRYLVRRLAECGSV
jgi:RNA polymerase sigma-70 factor (ECF subfamily)